MESEYVESAAPETSEVDSMAGDEVSSVDLVVGPLEGETGGLAVDYRPQLNVIQESLTAFQDHMTRPFMTTPFEEYTVSEGLVLLLLAFLILQSLIKIVKVGFSWLL